MFSNSKTLATHSYMIFEQMENDLNFNVKNKIMHRSIPTTENVLNSNLPTLLRTCAFICLFLLYYMLINFCFSFSFFFFFLFFLFFQSSFQYMIRKVRQSCTFLYKMCSSADLHTEEGHFCALRFWSTLRPLIA